MQDIYDKYKFLYEYGNPIIKNEAAIYLGEHEDNLRLNMLKCPEVQYWINCLHYFITKPQIHNGADTCFENAMHKLVSYGVKEKDDKRIQEVNTFILELLDSVLDNQTFFDSVNATILASWLACMGHTEKIVIDILQDRVDKVYSFVKDKDYNIHVDPKGFPAIPKARAMHPLVNPKLYENNIWRLPTIHDIFAYTQLSGLLPEDDQTQQKIDTIIEYIFDERYQRLYIGYGLMLVPPNKYYSMGWSMHLCRYFESTKAENSTKAESKMTEIMPADNTSTEKASAENKTAINTTKENTPIDNTALVWQMALMSNFKKARETKWFKNNLEHLKSFEKDGIYQFPPSYLREEKNKYYVIGCHMGLGEEKKNKMRIKLESTAWMLRIIDNGRC